MKIQYKLITLSIIFGFSFWIIDTTLDYFFFYEGTFLKLLFFNVPKIYTRLFILANFILFGIIVSEMMAKEKLAEKALQKAYQKSKELEYIINHCPAVAFRWRNVENWLVEFVSNNIQQFGYSPKEFYSGRLPFISIIHPDDVERVITQVNRYTEEKREEFFQEYRIIAKTGEVCWIGNHIWIKYDSNGTVTHYQGIILDITERKETDKTLRRTNRTLRALSKCNQAVVRAAEESALLNDICRIIVDIEGYCLAWVGVADEKKNVYPVAQAGYEAGYLDTLHITCADTEFGQGPTGTAIRTGKPSINQNLLINPDFIPWRNAAIQQGYASSIALPLLDNKRKPFGALNIYAVESDAFDNEEVKLLSSLAANLSYGIIALRIRAENKVITEVLQKRTDELGERVKELNCLYNISHLVENKDVSLLEILEKTVEFIPFGWQYSEMACARIIFDNQEFRTKNFQETIWQQSSEIIVHNKPIGLIEVYYLEEKPKSDEKSFSKEERNLIDAIAERMGRITELKRAEAALADEREHLAQLVAERTSELSIANAELSRAARLKDEFLANMSHELRTPLSGILGLSEALQEKVYGPLNKEQLKSLHSIEVAGHHLLSMINDILDVSKIDAGKLTLKVEPISLKSVCLSSIGLVKQIAQKKKIIISQNIDSSITIIQADNRRLKQILVNLLSNAIKFTTKGHYIGLEVIGDAVEEVIHFTVWDTGIGISESDIKKLFQPFIQVDSSLKRRYEGTGLGLALVRRLAEMHGGSISLSSEEGKGSRFTVSLPWQKAALMNTSTTIEPDEYEIITPTPSINAHHPAPLILLTDDNEDIIRLISNYLQVKGYRITVARNGAEAIERAKEESPSLILMDIQMPVMDGLEATIKIRSEKTDLAKVPIIALTALAMPGDKEQCLAAGVNKYLSKPVSMKNLIKIIELQLSSQY